MQKSNGQRLWSEERTQKEKKGGKVNLAFFPEGGNAVVGIASRIGFKAWGAKGEDLQITGAVYNSSGNSVSFLSTYHQGMGFFELLPETTSYKVIVEHEGKQYDFNFQISSRQDT